MKEIKNIITKIRKVGPTSFGLTIPLEVIKLYGLEEDDAVVINLQVADSIVRYRCGVCGVSFSIEEDVYTDSQCPACGETQNLIVEEE